MGLTLQGARLVDGTGRDPVDATAITIHGGRITAVGTAAGDRTIDCTGLTVLPGLIDAHSHLGLVDLSEDGFTAPVALLAAKIFRVCAATIDAGFTTVRDAGGVDGGVARATETGLVRGPRIYPSGPLHCQTGGHGDMRRPYDERPLPAHPGLVQISRVVDGPEDMRRAVREAFRRGATQIKVAISGGVASTTDRMEDPQLSVEELRAAVEEAEARDTYVLAHAHSVRGMRAGLRAGVRCFEHATFLDEETAAAMAEAGAAIVPTLAVINLMASEGASWGLSEAMIERSKGVEESMVQAIEIARAHGVKVGSGSDLLGSEQNRRGLEIALKARVMGAMAAIESTTRVNAEIMGIADEVGTVEEGKRADLIAIDGDPLADPSLFDDPDRVVLVVKDGVVVKDRLEGR